MKRLSSCAVAVFIKQLQQHGHAKLNLWRRKRYGMRLDSLLYLSWFTARIKHDRLLVYLVFNGLLERHQYESETVNAMFLNCLCPNIFLENSRVYFPILFTDCLQWSSKLRFVFLDVAVIRQDRTTLRDQCVSLTSKQRHQKQRPFCSVSIHLSVRPSVRPSIHPSIHPFIPSFFVHSFIQLFKFTELITKPTNTTTYHL